MMDEERFGGIGRLYGTAAAERICAARVAVVGIGGVGSWAAEALARSGVGTLILMDLDDICITNTNRQIEATEGAYGRSKAEVMAERVRSINPNAQVLPLLHFYSAKHPEHLFDTHPDVVVDAIDDMHPKAHLIAECRRRGVPVVTCGGAGGRVDAACITVADLARTHHDNMLVQLRKELRKQYGFPLEDKCPEIGIPCVYSPEKPLFPRCDGSVSTEREPGTPAKLGCAAGYGSATHVTGTFGFMAAGAALQIITQSHA